MVKLDPPPKNYRNCGGKKVNFSGDYFSGLVPFGIWRPVRVEATEKVRVKNIRTDVKVASETKATVKAQFTVFNHMDTEQQIDVVSHLRGKNCETQDYFAETKLTVQPGEHTVEAEIEVDQAKLWWPWDMGDQNLYLLDAIIKQGDTELDRAQETIGLREVQMDFNPGYTRDEAEFPWTFFINANAISYALLVGAVSVILIRAKQP